MSDPIPHGDETTTLPPAAPLGEAPTLPPEPIRPAPIGDGVSVPGYEILATLGRGGMGVVYQARQIKLGRIVALKMILSGVHAGEADLARFKTEAEAIARVQHPNIVQIYEVGEQSGLPFFSLEFCGGGSLEKKLNGTPLAPPEAAALIETLARAMQAAHDKGVIHRDLKPANVLLAEDGTPKITDFGLAKKLDEAGQTASGAVMGTPSYMAPEQAGHQPEASARGIGPAADVYALGAILYECLTGRPPFRAATALDTLLQVVSDEPVPPSQLQSKTPRDLETICLKCLQKEPARRYASATALADDLRRFQQGEAIHARPVGRVERLLKWARRRPAAAALIVVSVLAVLAVVGVFGGAAAVVYDANHNLEQANTDLADQRDKARSAEDNARNAEKTAHEKETEATTQLNRSRHLLMTAQLLRAAPLVDSDPVQARSLLDNAEACPADLRDFCWRYLRGRCDRESVSVLWSGESAVVTASAMGANKTLIAWGMADGTITLWDQTAKQARATRKGHNGVIYNLFFAADGRTLTSAGADGAVRVWDTTSLTEKDHLKGERGRIRSVAFSTDRKIMATGSNDGTVKLWDAVTGEERSVLGKGKGPATALAFSPDGQLLAMGGNSPPKSAVTLWDLATRKERATLTVGFYGVNALAFAPDGKTLAFTTNILQFIDFTANPPRIIFTGTYERSGHILVSPGDFDIGNAGVLAFAADGRTLAYGEGDALKLVDVPSGKTQKFLRGQAEFVMSLAWSTDGESLVSSSTTMPTWTSSGKWAQKCEIRLWNWPKDQRHPLETPVAFAGFAVSPDGKTVAIGQKEGLTLCDAAQGTPLRTLSVKRETMFLPLAFSTDGKRLLLRDLARGNSVWDLSSDRQVVIPSVGFCAISPDGRLVAGAGNKHLKLWDATTGQELATLQELTTRIGPLAPDVRVAFSPDGSMLASGDDKGVIRLWDVASRKERQTLSAYTKGVMWLAFSPDGKTLASTGQEATVKAWDVSSGRERFPPIDLHEQVVGLAFSHDGHDLAIGGLRAVTILDAATGQPRLTLAMDQPGLLAFSPDDSLLLASQAQGNNPHLRVWQAVLR